MSLDSDQILSRPEYWGAVFASVVRGEPVDESPVLDESPTPGGESVDADREALLGFVSGSVLDREVRVVLARGLIAWHMAEFSSLIGFEESESPVDAGVVDECVEWVVDGNPPV